MAGSWSITRVDRDGVDLTVNVILTNPDRTVSRVVPVAFRELLPVPDQATAITKLRTRAVAVHDEILARNTPPAAASGAYGYSEAI